MTLPFGFVQFFRNSVALRLTLRFKMVSRRCLWATVAVLALLVWYWLRQPVVSPQSLAASARAPLEPRLDALLESPAYCTSTSTPYANCRFRNACVSVDNASEWFVDALPTPNWQGVSLRSRKALYRDSAQLSGCNHLWRPSLKSHSPTSAGFVDPKSTYFANGTWFFACSFYPIHYGHTLMEGVIPTGLALEQLAELMPSVFSLDPNNVQLVSQNGLFSNAQQATRAFFSLLTGASPSASNTVEELSAMMSLAKSQGKAHLCFQELGIGFKAQSSLEFSMNTRDVQPELLERFRQRVRRRFSTLQLPSGYSWEREDGATCECKVLIELRPDRQFANSSDLVEWLAKRTGCCVMLRQLTSLSLGEQVRLVSDVDVYICPLGSGCHNFLWLKPKGVVIVVTGFVLHVPADGRISGGGNYLNDWLCYHLRRDILCLTVPSNGTGVREVTERVTWLHKAGVVAVDYPALENALEWVQLHNGVGIQHWDPVKP